MTSPQVRVQCQFKPKCTTPLGEPRGVCQDSTSALREREGEQRAALAGPEHAGQEALGPGAPAGRHGDELPAVHLVGARARVVATAALELPEQVARLRV